MSTRQSVPAIDRAASKYVIREDGCWEWTAQRDSKGYGIIRGDAPDSRSIKAHRLLWISVNGPIPDSLQIDHLCKRTWCVNPEHLRPLTLVQNVMIGNSPHAANARKKSCPKCGGPYSLRPSNDRASGVRRWCPPCTQQHDRDRRKR